MSDSVENALAGFFQRHIQASGLTDHGIIEYDPEWQSPCQSGSENEGKINWQPVKRSESESLNNIEIALELQLHPDIHTFYTQFYAPTLDAYWQGDLLSLIQVWNEDDFAILQENMLGHLMMKRKLKQQATVFIATTDNDEYLISVLNKTGEVMLERVGCEPHLKLADNIAEFIELLSCN